LVTRLLPVGEVEGPLDMPHNLAIDPQHRFRFSTSGA
jgi:hypothetical protein